MSYQRLAYDDQDTAGKMHADCAACAPRFSGRRHPLDPDVVTAGAPSLRYADQPRETPKPEIEVSAAAAHLAARLHLHLD